MKKNIAVKFLIIVMSTFWNFEAVADAEGPILLEWYKCDYLGSPLLVDKPSSVNIRYKSTSRDPICLAQIHCRLNAIVEGTPPPRSLDQKVFCPSDSQTKKCTKSAMDCAKDENLELIDSNVGNSQIEKSLNESSKGGAR